VGKLSLDITTTTSTQPCILPESLNRVPVPAGSKRGKVTAAVWQVTLCDPKWHVISHSAVVISITNCYIWLTLLYFTLHLTHEYTGWLEM